MAQPPLTWMIRRSSECPQPVRSGLIDVYKEVFPAIWAENMDFIRNRVNRGSYNVTAQLKDHPCTKVVAGLTFRLHEANNYVEILLMGVRIDYQRNGLGRMAFNELVAFLRRKFPFDANAPEPRSGINTVCVWASETSIDFYKRLGFATIDPRTRHYADAQHYTLSKLLEYFLYE